MLPVFLKRSCERLLSSGWGLVFFRTDLGLLPRNPFLSPWPFGCAVAAEPCVSGASAKDTLRLHSLMPFSACPDARA